jgi:hypothetical protein
MRTRRPFRPDESQRAEVAEGDESDFPEAEKD